MARPARKAMIRRIATRRKSRSNSPRGSRSRKSRLKRSPTHMQVKYRGARISRSRLRSLREDLDRTRIAVNDLHEKFWVTSEQDIREMLAQTQKKIGRAVDALESAG